MRISQLDYNNFVGLIGVGRIQRGKVRTNMPVSVIDRHGKKRQGKVLQVLGFMGLERVEVAEAEAGDIIAISGVADLSISDTICALDTPEALPALTVDEPTISMTFQVNNSPFAGNKDLSGGKFLTSRQLRERLERETLHNVALKVEEGSDPDKFLVSGRGELHLSVLIETMRREGFELAVSRPEVIIKEIDGQQMEPIEQLVVDIEEQHQGGVMEKLGTRKAQLKNMEPDGKGRVRLDYMIPARGLIGFQNEFRTLTQGSGLLFHVFDHYGPKETGAIAKRINGVMIANAPGVTPAYSLGPLEERGKLFAAEGDNVYEGQLIGIHSKDNDLTVNAIKTKPLTNMRASGKDENIKLTPAIKYTLEQALDFIEDDELVEVTPKEIRLRKKFLTETDRKRGKPRSAEPGAVPRLASRRRRPGTAGTGGCRAATMRGHAEAPPLTLRRPDQWHATLCFIGHGVQHLATPALLQAFARCRGAHSAPQLHDRTPGVLAGLRRGRGTAACVPALAGTVRRHPRCAASLRHRADAGHLGSRTSPSPILGRHHPPQPWLDVSIAHAARWRRALRAAVQSRRAL